jgi:hypothetical protein
MNNSDSGWLPSTSNNMPVARDIFPETGNQQPASVDPKQFDFPRSSVLKARGSKFAKKVVKSSWSHQKHRIGLLVSGMFLHRIPSLNGIEKSPVKKKERRNKIEHFSSQLEIHLFDELAAVSTQSSEPSLKKTA